MLVVYWFLLAAFDKLLKERDEQRKKIGQFVSKREKEQRNSRNSGSHRVGNPNYFRLKLKDIRTNKVLRATKSQENVS